MGVKRNGESIAVWKVRWAMVPLALPSAGQLEEQMNLFQYPVSCP